MGGHPRLWRHTRSLRPPRCRRSESPAPGRRARRRVPPPLPDPRALKLPVGLSDSSLIRGLGAADFIAKRTRADQGRPTFPQLELGRPASAAGAPLHTAIAMVHAAAKIRASGSSPPAQDRNAPAKVSRRPGTDSSTVLRRTSHHTGLHERCVSVEQVAVIL